MAEPEKTTPPTGGDTTQPKQQKQQPKGKKGKKGKKNTNRGGRGRSKFLIETESVIGTRDCYPDDMRLRNWLFDHFKAVGEMFAFQNYDAPILELQELYKRKAGEEITEQMYCFEDKEKYNVALRPEMTPTLARMILKAGKRMLFPIRWYSIPQCWRFENMTRGRKREHYQWNMDIVGVKDISGEAELLAAVTTFFKRLGLTSKDVGIKVNSRKILQMVLEPLGVVGEKFAKVCVIVDKMDKMEAEEVEKQLIALELETTVIDEITKSLAMKSMEELKERFGDDNVVVNELVTLWDLAEAYGYQDWLVLDCSVVRGLAYYTGVVFEAFDRGATLRAICGGGRYDKLLSIYGGQDKPACGFGFGDCVIIELLKDKGLLPKLERSIDDFIIPFNEELRPAACKVAAKLRSQGRKVDVQLMPKKRVPWCLNYADRVGAERAIFVAPDEWKNGEVRIKFLRETDEAKKQINVKFEDL